MGVERAVIPVDDLGAAIERFEAEGYRLVTISPADAPRTVSYTHLTLPTKQPV